MAKIEIDGMDDPNAMETPHLQKIIDDARGAIEDAGVDLDAITIKDGVHIWEKSKDTRIDLNKPINNATLS